MECRESLCFYVFIKIFNSEKYLFHQVSKYHVDLGGSQTQAQMSFLIIYIYILSHPTSFLLEVNGMKRRFQDAKFIFTARPEDPGVVIGPQGVRYVLGEVPDETEEFAEQN